MSINAEIHLRIDDLPDFPSLQQLAGALWRQRSNGKGAAVLVGSGFSRNARMATFDTPEPPLWSHLIQGMTSRLYPAKPKDAISDPLRLAEEFRAYFGQSALDDFLRASIADESWYPGAAHKLLLELPWSEVLTTNWDTLLERSSRSVFQHHYQVVHNAADLARTRSPRIVKLHGTIGGSEPYIFAEEDYRTYPSRNAAMVNFVRQVFIENELCLLGFSGSDPNFLQWSGWVRDHLASASRRIYLVGVLGLGPATRKLLESRNIAPIDLSPLVEDLPHHVRHNAANDLLIRYLHDARLPADYEWKAAVSTRDSFIPAAEIDLRTTPEYALPKLLSLVSSLRQERSQYPGWLVCPSDLRRQITLQIPGIEELFRIAQKSMAPMDTERVAIELAWRYETSFSRLSKQARDLITSVVSDQEDRDLDGFEHRMLISVLLRDAREHSDYDSFEHWSSAMISLGRHDPEALAEANYQRCLLHGDRLEYEKLDHLLHSVDGTDPAWKMRKAYLLSILHRWDDAERQVSFALDDIRERFGNARNSIWLRSRRTWCQWLLAATTRFRNLGRNEDAPEFSKEAVFQCNPWDEIQAIRSEVEGAVRDNAARLSESVIPLFKPGAYRDNSRTVHFRSAPVAPTFGALTRFMETVGIPVFADRTTMLSFYPEAMSLSEEKALSWYLKLPRYARDEKQPLTIANLGRIAIATMDQTLVSNLRNHVAAAIQYWRGRAGNREASDARIASDVLADLVSFLFRLTPRMSSEEANNCFYLGMELAALGLQTRSPLIEACRNLIDNAVLAMSADARHRASLDAFEFPLASERGLSQATDRWPTPFDALNVANLPKIRCDNLHRWSLRVDALLKLCQDKTYRSDALNSLTELSLKNELSKSERDAFGVAIWSMTDGASGLPVETTLHAAVFGKLPHPPEISPENLLKTWLFSSPSTTAKDIKRLSLLVFAASENWGHVLPNSSAAKALLKEIVQHAGAMADDSLSSHFSFLDERVKVSAGSALADSVLPALKGGLSDHLFESIIDAIESIPLQWAIAGLPYLARGSRVDVVANVIQRGLFSTHFAEVAGAARGLSRWADLTASKGRSSMPSTLTESLLLAVELRQAVGLQAILFACRKLLGLGLFNKTFRARLAKAVTTIIRDYDYKNIDPTDRRAVSASMVRAECVHLARSLDAKTAGEFLARWLQEAKHDPLPEVRKAVEETGSDIT